MGASAPLKAVRERVQQFGALRLAMGDGGMINRRLAFLPRLENALGHHAVHQRAHGGICPAGGLVQFLLHCRRGTGLRLPNYLDYGPFRAGQFDEIFGHARIISTNVEQVKWKIYKCRGSGI